MKLRTKYQILVSSLVTAAVFNTKIEEVENKILCHAKHITTQKFNKLTARNYSARLKTIFSLI